MVDGPKAPVGSTYLRPEEIVSIAGDGLIASALIGDGRAIPTLILDTSSRVDIEEYIRVHGGTAAGDVRCQWAHFPDQSTIVLMLSVERPLVLKILIGFRLAKSQGILVEQILKVNGLCLQAGRPKDRLVDTLGNPRVIVEVPETGFRPTWDKIFLNHTAAVLRDKGIASNRAKAAAADAIKMMRETGALRLPFR